MFLTKTAEFSQMNFYKLTPERKDIQLNNTGT